MIRELINAFLLLSAACLVSAGILAVNLIDHAWVVWLFAALFGGSAILALVWRKG